MTHKTAIMAVATLLWLALASCGGKAARPAEAESPRIDTTATLVKQARRCARLYTTEARVHKVVTHDDQISLRGKLLNHDYDIGLPLGKRKVAIPIDATLKAYVDFADFGSGNVSRDSTHIQITLPDPHIVLTSTRIRHDEIREYVALTRRNFSDEELAAYEQQGRKAIIESIPDMTLLESARAGAANVLVPLLKQLGFKEENITVSFRRDLSHADITRLVETPAKQQQP